VFVVVVEGVVVVLWVVVVVCEAAWPKAKPLIANESRNTANFFTVKPLS
jgi:hypothetical protein